MCRLQAEGAGHGTQLSGKTPVLLRLEHALGYRFDAAAGRMVRRSIDPGVSTGWGSTRPYRGARIPRRVASYTTEKLSRKRGKLGDMPADCFTMGIGEQNSWKSAQFQRYDEQLPDIQKNTVFSGLSSLNLQKNPLKIIMDSVGPVDPERVLACRLAALCIRETRPERITKIQIEPSVTLFHVALQFPQHPPLYVSLPNKATVLVRTEHIIRGASMQRIADLRDWGCTPE